MNEPFGFTVRACHVGRRLCDSLTTDHPVRFAQNALRGRLTSAARTLAAQVHLEAAPAASLIEAGRDDETFRRPKRKLGIAATD
jgi:hypothetical protein